MNLFFHQNHFNMIFILFNCLNVIHCSDSSIRSCDNKNLFTIGTKASCESDNELSTSCFGNPFKVKLANLQCISGYYNNQSLTVQKIECLDNYEWSEKPIHCLPECDNNLKILKLIEDNEEKIPPWYAEIIKNSTQDGIINRYPGIILSERAILTYRKYCINNETQKMDLNKINEYSIKLPNSKTIPNKYKVTGFDVFEDDLCILQLPNEAYIKFNSDIKPTCGNLNLPEVLGNRSLDETTIEFSKNNFLPIFEGECVVPTNVDRAKIEIVCYKGRLGDVTECGATAPYVATRCQIGYFVKGLDKVPYLSNDENLSECSRNRWYHRFDEDQCQLVCGVIDKNSGSLFQPLSHNGKKTDIVMAPWHVGIYLENEDTYTQICGGTIIHINLVISAAHCFYLEAFSKVDDPSKYLIGAGKNYRSYEATEEFSHFAGIRYIYIPPNYQARPIRNDIAILVLNQYLEFNTHIKPICIDWEPYENIIQNGGIEGYLVGWGSTSPEDINSPELLRIDLLSIPNKECKKRVDPNVSKDITDDKFCAINSNHSSACKGDSGGGYVIKKNIGYGDRHYLAGIVSFGVNNQQYCSDGFVTLFENIFFSRNKIKELIALSRE